MSNFTAWHQCDIDKKTLKRLMKRSDGKALVHIGAYGVMLALLAAASVYWWGAAPGILAYIAYGAVFGCLASLEHETHHGTPFRTRWINETVHWIAGLLAVKEPFSDRWLHTKHHTHTYETGADVEIQTERPPSLGKLALDFFRIPFLLNSFALMGRYAIGALPRVIREEAPVEERRKIIWSARAILGFYALLAALGLAYGQWFPLILTLGAKISGGWLHAWMSYTQHTGMPENVNDHRLNTRTVYTHPVLQFLYWNMNYHIEHHMFPMVPFYALPALYRELKSQMPLAYPGFWAAWREIIPTLVEQTRDPNYFVDRKLHPAILD
ncbi:fatty acid desaturase [Chelativorans sp. AA-79]|uniref:fatty acid desaturase n=1 Tax=Chelativorans sp. AA-79 TaxID=3028735 RepID=UPI0023FA2F3D|nr:fatty acid desaturase [Chelativorans sp. AA-79]WEX08677.1 fatty acid desaturase [Chelativorans sp. AA-79]